MPLDSLIAQIMSWEAILVAVVMGLPVLGRAVPGRPVGSLDEAVVVPRS